MSCPRRAITMQDVADPLMDGDTSIPALVNRLLLRIGQQGIPQTASLSEFRDSLQSMVEYVDPSMPRPSMKELSERTRRRREGIPQNVALASRRPPAPQQSRHDRRMEIAQDIAKRRNITVEKALSFVPQ